MSAFVQVPDERRDRVNELSYLLCDAVLLAGDCLPADDPDRVLIEGLDDALSRIVEAYDKRRIG